eukprot:CAMPEP_0206423156 /NCGR_PEP_ID=MMETSP0324_2-20121206/2523_1 /ASSEMBLY_ACC=CAM_ASM_000836 /TAXON_ID=2866 /ORGANISM="Crypthecodinium cohnii, Strain Seligo" /LENGTH=467 /DNA_ID=CAMNT_0053887683 /DNA_START=54 /DNA_END=1457 /DNA_ORIENTATION=-
MGCGGSKQKYGSVPADDPKKAAQDKKLQEEKDKKAADARDVAISEEKKPETKTEPAPTSGGPMAMLGAVMSGFSTGPAAQDPSREGAATSASSQASKGKDSKTKVVEEAQPLLDMNDIKQSGAEVRDIFAPLGRSNDTERAMKYISQYKDLPDDSPLRKGIACFLQWGIKPLIVFTMAYIWLMKQLYKVYKLLPTNLVQMIFGCTLCFFGGVYFTGLAAAEAANNMGGADMYANLMICYEEATNVANAQLKDEEAGQAQKKEVDDENLSLTDLAQRKAKVAMVAVKDPAKLQQAFFSLANVYMAVLATLKFQFAKTVAIALGIANLLTSPAIRIIGTPMAMVMGKDLAHWVPAIIDTLIKIIAVWVATWVQAFISAFYSGLRGGRMFAEGLFNILTQYGVMEYLPDCITAKPFDPDQSYLDEAIAYPLAAVGFYMQVSSNFAIPFPLNIVLMPLTILEYVLRYQVYT